MGQMALSASNYAVFVVLARILDPGDFIAFSTAVGLNMLAWAIAEGGVSYVAPREMATAEGRRGGRTAGAFLTLSVGLYVAATFVGFFSWNLLSQEPLDAMWVGAYSLYVIPTLLIPSWVTCWSLDAAGLTAIVVARGAIVVAVARFPAAATLGLSGLMFFVCVLLLTAWLNRGEAVVARTNLIALRSAIRNLRGVFVAKTMSYAVYGLAPMIIGASRGGFASSDYVTGERMKSLYATLFQPVIQTVYLAQFQTGIVQAGKQLAEKLVQSGNILLALLTLFGIQWGLLGVLGERFEAVLTVQMYVIAACLSVASASLLYFRVFPSGDFRIFRRATVVQMVVFTAMFVLVALVPAVPVAWILGAGEAALLAALLGQLVLSRSSRDRYQAVR